MSGEEAPLAGVQGLDPEKASYAGSHVDKLCLLPFALCCAILGCYGVEGIQRFNIYEEGARQAKIFCSPLDNVEDHCKQNMVPAAHAIAAVAAHPEIIALQEKIQRLTDIQSFAQGVCVPLTNAADVCGQIGALARSTRSIGKTQADRAKQQCTRVAASADHLCSDLNAMLANVSSHGDGTIAAFANCASKRFAQDTTRIVTAARGKICPLLKPLPEKCTSLTRTLQDSVASVKGSALKLLPEYVPVGAVDAALDEATAQIADQAEDACSGVASVAERCESMFSSQTWRPKLEQMQSPLSELHAMLKETVANLVGHAHQHCAAAASFGNGDCDGADATDQLSDLTAQLAELQKQCRAATATVAKPCGAVTHAAASLSANVKQISDSLSKLGGFSSKARHVCNDLQDFDEHCLAVANPCSVIAEGVTALWQRKRAELLHLEIWLLAWCSVTVGICLHVIKNHTGAVVTFSIVMNLSSIFASTMFSLLICNYASAIMYTIAFALKIVWFICARSRFNFAVQLIECGVEALQRLLGLGIWIMSLLIIAVQVGVILLTAGAYYHLTSLDAPQEAAELQSISPFLIPTILIFCFTWVVEVVANTLHITVCCCVGGKCGLDTPAKSFCGAVCFSLTGGIGSNAFGSFLIAALKAFQYFIEKYLEEDSANPCIRAIVKALCCVSETVAKMFNSYAFVFVGLKGSSYCTASRKTLEVFTKKGLAAIATDQALHDVVILVKHVSWYFSTMVALYLGFRMRIIVVWGRPLSEIIMGPAMCLFIGFLTSYALTLSLGRMLEAVVCTLFIIYGEADWKLLMSDSGAACLKDKLDEIQSEHKNTNSSSGLS